MSLVDDEVIGEYEEVSSGQVHLEQARCLIPTVTNEALVTPAIDSKPNSGMPARIKSTNILSPWYSIVPEYYIWLVGCLVLGDRIDLAS